MPFFQLVLLLVILLLRGGTRFDFRRGASFSPATNMQNIGTRMSDEPLSAYELQRDENVRRNNVLLLQCVRRGEDLQAACSALVVGGAPRVRKPPARPVEVRRSSRVACIPVKSYREAVVQNSPVLESRRFKPAMGKRKAPDVDWGTFGLEPAQKDIACKWMPLICELAAVAGDPEGRARLAANLGKHKIAPDTVKKMKEADEAKVVRAAFGDAQPDLGVEIDMGSLVTTLRTGS